MAEYITKKKKKISDPSARKEEGRKRDSSGFTTITDEELKKITGAPEFGKDVVIMAPDRLNKRSGGKVCKLATKGKGRAYGKNS